MGILMASRSTTRTVRRGL